MQLYIVKQEKSGFLHNMSPLSLLFQSSKKSIAAVQSTGNESKNQLSESD